MEYGIKMHFKKMQVAKKGMKNRNKKQRIIKKFIFHFFKKNR